MTSTDTATIITMTEASADRESTPLALTDNQLDQIMRHAAVLHPGLRRAYVERVAYELRNQEIDDGLVYRMCAKVLKESGLFDPPLSTEPTGRRRVGGGKYA